MDKSNNWIKREKTSKIMVEFYARHKTKTKVPISFKTSSGKRIRFKARRISQRRKKIKF